MNLDESRIKEINELKKLLLRAREIASSLLVGKVHRSLTDSELRRFLDDTDHLEKP
jgi:hypothetical protein